MLVAKIKNQQDWKYGWYSANEVTRKQKYLCFYCNHSLVKGKRTRDHLFPKCRGFTLPGNMVITCAKCNLAKGPRLPTLAEILKAWHLIYKDRPQYFVCQIRNDKPVFQVNAAWYFILTNKKHNQIVIRNNKPVLRLYN